MKRLRHIALTVFTGLLGALLSAPIAWAQARDIENITVLADATLAMPISRLIIQYSRIQGASVSGVYKTAAEHRRMIEDGEPADLLITADRDIIEALEGKGLIDVASPVAVATTGFVIATSPSSTAAFQGNTAETLLASHLQWVTLDPALYPEGAGVALKLSATPLSAPNAKEMARMVGMNPQLLALVPQTLAQERGLSVVSAVTSDQIPAVTYTGVVVASENMEAARKLLRFLSSPEASATLKEMGFDQP